MRTYGVFCEDEEEELWCRQCAINKLYQLDNVCLSYRVWKNNILMVFDNKDIGKLTPYFQDLLEDIELSQSKLVILDTATGL